MNKNSSVPADSDRVRPDSATHQIVAWSGAAGLLLGVTAMNFWAPSSQIAYIGLIVLACAAVGVFLPDLLWQRVQRRTLAAPAPTGDWSRSLTKLAGLAASAAFVALLYWLFPEYYRDHSGFYTNYWMALQVAVPVWLVLALPYIYWVDRRMAAPRDALWQLGRLVTGRWHDVQPRVVGQHLLGWLVKAFFLPLMFTYFCSDLYQLLHYDLGRLHGFRGLYDWAYFALYFIDVAMVSMTYPMSLRLTDTHIRSTEPTLFGWAIALLCYQPFWSLVNQHYLDYDTGRRWDLWLAHLPWLYTLWGCLVLALVAVYVWATISFGGRFSNLTHRGIITSGPYRYTRHPAYLAKNLSWWLISMPFLATDGAAMALRRCLMLALLNAVYYLRAKTEERHLATDPVYVQYSAWIERHGALRWLDRIPGIRTIARWRPQFRTWTRP